MGNKMDKNSLGFPKDEDFNVETEGQQEEGFVLADEDEEESEYYLYRLERLLLLDQSNKEPTLNPDSFFVTALIDDSAFKINKKDFDSRLKNFLEQEGPDKSSLSDELVEFLFKRAVDAHRHLKTWKIIINKIKSVELDKNRRYVTKELNRYIKIRSLLKGDRKDNIPTWMSEWKHCWIGAFEEIQDEVENQLRCAKSSLDSLAQMRKSARLEMKSYLLWFEEREIRKRIARTPFARNLEVIRAAFAYAADLVSPVEDFSNGTDGYRSLIKQRIWRVSTSPKKTREAAASILRTFFAMQHEEAKSKPSS